MKHTKKVLTISLIGIIFATSCAKDKMEIVSDKNLIAAPQSPPETPLQLGSRE